MKIGIEVGVAVTIIGCGGAPPPSVVHAPAIQQSATPASVAGAPSASAVTPAAAASAPPEAAGAAKPVELAATAIPLPGASAPVSLDFIFYEPEPSRVWVPAGGSGSVDAAIIKLDGAPEGYALDQANGS
jgi:hypothetical protein